MSHVALRIVNYVSYVSRINDESYFLLQVQYGVDSEGESCCPANSQKPFICDKD